MKLISHNEVPLSRQDLAGLRYIPPGSDPNIRTQGQHLSDILRAKAIGAGLLDKDTEELGDILPPRVILGFAWEQYAVQYVANQYPSLVYQPGELNQDGVIMTPDALAFEDGDTMVVQEFKTTSKKLKPACDDNLWLWQVMGYCYAAGATKAVWWVLWLNGDYKERREAIFTRTEVTFGANELSQWWERFIKPSITATTTPPPAPTVTIGPFSPHGNHCPKFKTINSTITYCSKKPSHKGECKFSRVVL